MLKNNLDIEKKIEQSVKFIRHSFRGTMDIGLVLGSGLNTVADVLKEKIIIPYAAIPGFPVSTVQGHHNRFIFGRINGLTIGVMQGRLHYYEGWSMKDIVFPVLLWERLGIRLLIVTNASGGINQRYRPGNIILLKDHINLMGDNPLIGREVFKQRRFVDLSYAYHPGYRAFVKKLAGKEHILLKEGIYAGLTGPNYETPAEVRMLRQWGADMAGMSTIPEVIMANALEIPVIGLSLIANYAAGVKKQVLSHEEVLRTGNASQKKFTRLILSIISNIKDRENLERLGNAE